MLAPICLFTYNRLNLTQQTIEALKKNYLAQVSELYIFSDGAKNEQSVYKVNEIRKYLKSVSGFKNVYIKESPNNIGLANSIITGVTEIIQKYGKVIVLEDDLICTPNFLNFMNKGLNFYKKDENIQSINGYSLSLEENSDEVYFQTRPFPWGWATWADSWNIEIFNKEKLKAVISSNDKILKQFNYSCGHDISKMLLKSINNQNDSWYVRWAFDHFRQNKYSAYPKLSYIQNIGHNEDGTHCKAINPYISKNVDYNKVDYIFSDFRLPKRQVTKEFLNYFTLQHKFWVRIKLLPSKKGRKEIISDIKLKLGIK